MNYTKRVGSLAFILRIRHVVFRHFLKVFVFHEWGFEKNHLGSIMSPLQVRVSWDSSLSPRALRLLEMLSHPASYEVQRFGSELDGGYFLPTKSMSCRHVISGGIGTDNNFEIQLGSLGMKVLQFDPTIEAPPESHAMLRFIKKGLGRGQLSLKDSIQRFEDAFGDPIVDGILKLDIEGSEWGLLDEFVDPEHGQDLVNAFSFIVIELHGLTSIYQVESWRQIEIGLNSILSHYQIVKAVGNNCREIVQIGGVPIIDVLEVTFERKKWDLPTVMEPVREVPASNIAARSPLYPDTFLVKNACSKCGNGDRESNGFER